MNPFLSIVGFAFLALVAYGVGVDLVRFLDDRDRRRHIEACKRIENRPSESEVRQREARRRYQIAKRDLRRAEAREVERLDALFELPARTPSHEEIP